MAERERNDFATDISKEPVSIEDDISIGILNLLKPAVEEVDSRVLDVRQSQLNLKEHIEQLTSDLQMLVEQQKPPVDIESYVKKLLNCRRRVIVVNSVLNNTHERLSKLQQNIIRETNKKKSALDASLYPS